MIEAKPESRSDEIVRLEKLVGMGVCARELLGFEPRLDRRLRLLDSERRAVLAALSRVPPGSTKIGPPLLRRIRALLKADTQVFFDCYWHDLGGEGGA